MEQLEQLKTWLMGFPLWEGEAPQIDQTGPQPGKVGLYPLGLEVLEEKANVMCQKRLRLRRQFLLRIRFPRGEAAARWLQAFENWVTEQAASAPVFGQQQRLFAQKGKLSSAQPTGLGLYEVRLTAEYTKEE